MNSAATTTFAASMSQLWQNSSAYKGSMILAGWWYCLAEGQLGTGGTSARLLVTLLLVTISAATEQQHSYLRSPGGHMSHPDNSRPAQAGECWVELLWPCCCVVVCCAAEDRDLVCPSWRPRPEAQHCPDWRNCCSLRPPPPSIQIRRRAESYCFEQDHCLCCKT